MESDYESLQKALDLGHEVQRLPLAQQREIEAMIARPSAAPIARAASTPQEQVLIRPVSVARATVPAASRRMSMPEISRELARMRAKAGLVEVKGQRGARQAALQPRREEARSILSKALAAHQAGQMTGLEVSKIEVLINGFLERFQ